MTSTLKQFLHYQSVAQQSLDKFKKIAQSKQSTGVHQLMEQDWQIFIDDKVRLQRYIDHVQDVSSIFGFSRELNSKLTYDELTSRVAERFAEVDLAEHIIRELRLTDTSEKLEKLAEGSGKRCDFKYTGNPSYYFESKYTRSIDVSKIANIARNALDQIKDSIIEKGGIGCVWIFTYLQPNDPRIFQQEIMKIKSRFSNIGFEFKLNVQVYARGLYGDATVI